MYWQTIPHTMFDFEDFYTATANSLRDNSRIAEVGVADGASAIFLGETLKALGKSFDLYMIDNLDYGHTEQLMTILSHVYGSGLYLNTHVMPIDSLNATLKFPDGFFDFVFIDSGHTYELTKAEIRLWHHKIKHGGVLAGHDYFLEENQLAVQIAVKEVVGENTEINVVNTSSGYGVWYIVKDSNRRQIL